MLNRIKELKATASRINIPLDGARLPGYLYPSPGARGVVIFAQSGYCPENSPVGGMLSTFGFSALLLDLVTAEEKAACRQFGKLWFDTRLLARRLLGAAGWLKRGGEVGQFGIGCFGTTTGAAVILIAASQRPELIRANVLLSGQSALAASALPNLKTPTMFIVGSGNHAEISANREAFNRCQADKKLVMLPDTDDSRRVGETLEEIVKLARDWFTRYLVKASARKQEGDRENDR